MVILSILPGAAFAQAPTVDEKFLKTLPAEERSLKDTVDHWGLPFSDQLRRFLAARETFRKSLGTQAPREFFVGTQHSLDKVPKNKYWFKGGYGVSVAMDAARNEGESIQIAVLPDIGQRLTGVTLSAGGLRSEHGEAIPAGHFTIYRVGYVETRPARYPSLYTGWWPDILLPNAPVEIGETDLGLFWVEVKVPRDAAPGTYRGQFALKTSRESVAVRVSLRVRDFVLPDRVPLPIAVWTTPAWPSGERMSKEDYRLLLAEFLRHGLDPMSVGKEDLWFYYCHLPIHVDFFRPPVQAPNMEIDNEAIEHRLALWLAWKYHTPGMFIWAGNQEWSGKATGRRDWEKTGWRLPDRPSPFPYGGIHNGNGYLVYPGPCPGIRLKVLRDGLEDYGYLMELKRRAEASSKQDLRARAARLLNAPSEVLVDAHCFNRDPAAMQRIRTAMADCIEALGPAR